MQLHPAVLRHTNKHFDGRARIGGAIDARVVYMVRVYRIAHAYMGQHTLDAGARPGRSTLSRVVYMVCFAFLFLSLSTYAYMG